MAIHKNAVDLLNSQKKRFGVVGRSLTEHHLEQATAAREDLVELTSGTLKAPGAWARGNSPSTSTPGGLQRGLSARQKKKLGIKRAPLLPINKQSGDLRETIFLNRVGAFDFELGSAAPHAKFIFHPAGTRYMVGRGVMGGKDLGYSAQGELERRWRARNMARILAYRQAFRKTT